MMRHFFLRTKMLMYKKANLDQRYPQTQYDKTFTFGRRKMKKLEKMTHYKKVRKELVILKTLYYLNLQNNNVKLKCILSMHPSSCAGIIPSSYGTKVEKRRKYISHLTMAPFRSLHHGCWTL